MVSAKLTTITAISERASPIGMPRVATKRPAPSMNACILLPKPLNAPHDA